MNSHSKARGNHLPLHRHVWTKIEGQEISKFRQSLDTKTKRGFSEIQGELFGHRYAEEILGYETIFHSDEKSIRQGLDGLYFDHPKNALVVVEFKGQNSSESKLQKRHDWSIVTCQKIVRGNHPYSQVSEYERTFASLVLKQIDQGGALRYELIRTLAQENQGIIYSQLEKQMYLEQSLNPSKNLKPTLNIHHQEITPWMSKHA